MRRWVKLNVFRSINIGISAFMFLLLSIGARAAEIDNVRILFASEQSGGTLALHSMREDGSDVRLHVPAAVRGRGEYEASISPDGQKIAFTTYRYGGWKIAISDIDGKNVRRLTMDPQYVYDPAWSPDGKTILYRRIENGSGPYYRGNAAIYAIDVDGRNNRRLRVNNREHIRNLSYASDGQHILYDAFIDDGIAIMKINHDGSGHTRISTEDLQAFAPSWSPDDKFIAHMRQDADGYIDVWLMHVDGSEARNLTRSKANGMHAIGEAFQHWQYETSVSPDGQFVAFTADYHDRGNADVYLVSIETGEIKRLTNNKGADLHPFWYQANR